MKAMILAAGRGSRMMPLTADMPKPLLKVSGKPLIQHLLEDLLRNGVENVVINHCYLGQQIEKELGDGHQLGINITYSAEDEMLDTAGGIVKALPLLGAEPFMLVNADIWTNYPYNGLPDIDGKKCTAHLVMVENANHHPKGDFCLSADGVLSGAQNTIEKTYTYSGIAVFHPSFFAGLAIETMPLRPLLEEAMKENLVSGEYFQGEWFDIGTPARLAELCVDKR